MNKEGYIDEHGTVWLPPTAFAYCQVCKARDRWRDEAEVLRRVLGELVYLKDMKASMPEKDYQARKSFAWEVARVALRP